jgi:hypothetical protein
MLDPTPGQLVKHMPKKGGSLTIIMSSKSRISLKPCYSILKEHAKSRSLLRVKQLPSALKARLEGYDNSAGSRKEGRMTNDEGLSAVLDLKPEKMTYEA